MTDWGDFASQWRHDHFRITISSFRLARVATLIDYATTGFTKPVRMLMNTGCLGIYFEPFSLIIRGWLDVVVNELFPRHCVWKSVWTASEPCAVLTKDSIAVTKKKPQKREKKTLQFPRFFLFGSRQSYSCLVIYYRVCISMPFE